MTDRPRLLDLFCGAGGAAIGYHRAGFDVTGVDIDPQPDYPYPFVQADATTYPLDGYDVIHASPPCHDHSSLRARTGLDHGTGWMLADTIDRLSASGVPWVVENVDNASGPSGVYRVRLCGSSFGLAVRRHRWFWSNITLLVPPCDHKTQGTPLGLYGNGGGGKQTRGVKATRSQGWAAMGLDHRSTSWRGLVQSIPPAYTEHLGAQLLAAVELGESGSRSRHPSSRS